MNALLTLLILAAIVGLSIAYGPLKGIVGVIGFLLLVGFGVRYLKSLATPPPDDEPGDVGDWDLRYVCTMCGLELKVEVASGDKPPRHCMEPMVLVGGESRERRDS